MNTRRTYNRRWTGWLLALTLFMMALPMQAAWLCPTGTICAADCPMLRGEGGEESSTVYSRTPVMAHCSHCAAPFKAPDVSRQAKTLHAPSGCVLRAQTQPAATLAGAFVILLPLLALPPPVQHHFVCLEELRAVPHPLPVFLLPPSLARPHPGRAPPVRLS